MGYIKRLEEYWAGEKNPQTGRGPIRIAPAFVRPMRLVIELGTITQHGWSVHQTYADAVARQNAVDMILPTFTGDMSDVEKLFPDAFGQICDLLFQTAKGWRTLPSLDTAGMPQVGEDGQPVMISWFDGMADAE